MSSAKSNTADKTVIAEQELAEFSEGFEKFQKKVSEWLFIYFPALATANSRTWAIELCKEVFKVAKSFDIDLADLDCNSVPSSPDALEIPIGDIQIALAALCTAHRLDLGGCAALALESASNSRPEPIITTGWFHDQFAEKLKVDDSNDMKGREMKSRTKNAGAHSAEENPMWTMIATPKADNADAKPQISEDDLEEADSPDAIYRKELEEYVAERFYEATFSKVAKRPSWANATLSARKAMLDTVREILKIMDLDKGARIWPAKEDPELSELLQSGTYLEEIKELLSLQICDSETERTARVLCDAVEGDWEGEKSRYIKMALALKYDATARK